MNIPFTKMHGLGNDFIILDAIKNDLTALNYQKNAKYLCDRNFGIGADGLIIIEDSDAADAKMRIINSDGTEPEMCGNGIRCFAKYVYDKDEVKKDVISVETIAGIMIPALILDGDQVIAIEVDMGEPKLLQKEIPMQGDSPNQQAVNYLAQVSNNQIPITAVSMGNPHCILFIDDINNADVKGVGSSLENSTIFPEKTNVEFIQVIDRNNIIMRVWERGVGETLACGTGACASVVAGVLTGQTERTVKFQLSGGNLAINWQEEDNHITMTGPAETVFSGMVTI